MEGSEDFREHKAPPDSVQESCAFLVLCIHSIFTQHTHHYLFVFPKVFPNIYLWVTFGVVTLLERLWKEHAVTVAMGRNVSPYAVELCCALERTLAYAYTGNAKVLSKSLLDPLFLSRSLLYHGLPTINTNIIKILATNHHRVVINCKFWPSGVNGPLTCSQGSHQMRYGTASWLVSLSNLLHSLSACGACEGLE